MKPLDHKRIIERELEGVGIRLNKKPPAITVTKKLKGGLNFSTSVKGALPPPHPHTTPHLHHAGARTISWCIGFPFMITRSCGNAVGVAD